MLPSVSLLYPDQFLFQQDNCPVHTAHIVQDWFRQNNIHIVDWPSRSPDLNPIQRQNLRPLNVKEMLEILHNTWETIEDDYCLNLCHSMPRRLAEVVNRNGAMTKY
jgi:hypothetical protein